jgi:hypothetical protein
MMQKILRCSALVMALSLMFCLSIGAQGQQVYQGVAQDGALPVGTEEPCILNQCLMYAGDFNANGQNPNGLWNNNSLLFGIRGAVYVPVVVPKKFKGAKGKTDWNVQGFFTNELMAFGTGVQSVDWAVVQGVAQGGNPSGGQVKTICSGTGSATVTPTGRNLFGFYFEQTILLTGASCPIIENGQYWLTFVPTAQGLAYLSDVEDNTPMNAQGPGTEPVDQSFFVSSFFGFPTFSGTVAVCGNFGCDSFSVGVVGSATH